MPWVLKCRLGTAAQGQPAAPQIIPIIGVWLGYFPLEFGHMFALAFCIYFPATHVLLYYCHDLSHMRSIFFSVIAGNMFWFAYAKARPPSSVNDGHDCQECVLSSVCILCRWRPPRQECAHDSLTLPAVTPASHPRRYPEDEFRASHGATQKMCLGPGYSVGPIRLGATWYAGNLQHAVQRSAAPRDQVQDDREEHHGRGCHRRRQQSREEEQAAALAAGRPVDEHPGAKRLQEALERFVCPVTLSGLHLVTNSYACAWSSRQVHPVLGLFQLVCYLDCALVWLVQARWFSPKP